LLHCSLYDTVNDMYLIVCDIKSVMYEMLNIVW